MTFLILPKDVVDDLEAEREKKRLQHERELNAALGNAVKTISHYLPESDTAVFERTQDCEGAIEANQTIRNSGFDGYNNDRSLRQVMNVPLGVIEKIQNDHGLNFFHKEDDKAFRRIIQSEYPYLLTVDKL